jgi:RimJ/RimL family protein N-acetyltransferase
VCEKGDDLFRRSRRVERPVIALDAFFVLDGWLPKDAAAHRRFALDPDAARFFGWTVEQAGSAPDSHYVEVITRFAREWREGTRFSLGIRRCSDAEAVGSVELRPAGREADVSYMVAPELRGRGLASRALEALIAWGARELGLQRVNLACHIDNTASQRVAERCGFVLVGREGDEIRFRRETRQLDGGGGNDPGRAAGSASASVQRLTAEEPQVDVRRFEHLRRSVDFGPALGGDAPHPERFAWSATTLHRGKGMKAGGCPDIRG